MSSAGISIMSFFIITCAKNNLAIRDEGLWVKSLGLYVGVSTQLFLSRLWVPVSLLSVFVALSSAIDYASIDCPIYNNTGMTRNVCDLLLISRTWGIILTGLSGTIVHMEHKLSKRLYHLLAFATWISFVSGLICLIFSNPFMHSNSFASRMSSPTIIKSAGASVG
eukprot:scaffold5771_cov171-Amphora_coffeaeformis.AAC.33